MQPRLVPEWLVNLAELGWRALVVSAAAAVLWTVSQAVFSVTVSVFVAIIFAAAFAPMVLRLRARGWSRTRSAAVVTFGALLLVVATLLLITLALMPYINAIAISISAAIDRLTAAIASASIPDALVSVIRGIAGWLAERLLETLKVPVMTITTVVILSVGTVFYLLRDGDRAWSWGIQAGAEWQRGRLTESGQTALERVGGYLRGLAILAGVNAIRDFILMVLLGIPLAGPISVLVFILGFIPYFGGIVGTVLITAIAWSSSGPQTAVLFLVGVGITSAVIGNVLRPMIYGKTVSMHPAVALVAIIGGSALGGVAGVFIAIPIVAMVLAVSRSVIDVLDATDQAVPPDVRTVPLWLDRLAQWSWRILVAIGLAALAVITAEAMPGVVIPVVFGLLVACPFMPVVETLVSRGWRRAAAAAAVTAVLMLVVLGVSALAVVSIVASFDDVRAQVDAGATAVDTAAGGRLGGIVEIVRTIGVDGLRTIAQAVATAGMLTLGLFISGILTFSFLKDGPRFWQWVLDHTPAWRRQPVADAGARTRAVFSGYLVAAGIVGAVGAVSQWLIMTLLGVPDALPLGVLALIGGFVPYFGGVTVTAAALFLTTATGTPEQVAVMTLWTLAFDVVQLAVVGPVVYGRAARLNPGVVLLAVPAAYGIAGLLGAFLVVPVLGVIAATWRVVLRAFSGAPAPDGTPSADAVTPASPLPGLVGTVAD